MFFRKKIDYSMINASSKMTLKLSCLQQARGNIKEADELYDYLADGIESLPDFPTPAPTAVQQFQQTAGSIFGWVKENQGDIVNAVNFIQQLRGAQPIGMPMAPPGVPPAEIPPLPPLE